MDFGFSGQSVMVVGGTTGIGAAAVSTLLDMKARVTVFDWKKPDSSEAAFIHLDLRDQSSIDQCVRSLESPIAALVICAGVAGGTPGLDRVNFAGPRHLLEAILDRNLLQPGSAVGMVSSLGGIGWANQLASLEPYLTTASYEEATRWIEEHPDRQTYIWTKQAVCAYVASKAFDLAKRGIRINAILPGPTDTPLAQANADGWLGFGKEFRDAVGLAVSTPEQQALPLLYLCSPAASYLNGQNIITDGGFFSSSITGRFDSPGVAALLAT